MFWLILIALFVLVPLVAGSWIHAAGGGRGQPVLPPTLIKARRPHIATSAQQTLSTTHDVTPTPAVTTKRSA